MWNIQALIKAFSAFNHIPVIWTMKIDMTTMKTVHWTKIWLQLIPNINSKINSHYRSLFLEVIRNQYYGHTTIMDIKQNYITGLENIIDNQTVNYLKMFVVWSIFSLGCNSMQSTIHSWIFQENALPPHSGSSSLLFVSCFLTLWSWWQGK
jgi:hypothetical protein